MVEAAAKYDRIVQHGVQLRSSKAIREAVQLLRNGYIGNVYMARGLVFRWRPDIGDKRFEPVPEGIDYMTYGRRPPCVRLQGTWFITTGTGTGIMAMVTWATRGYMRPIFACEDWM